MEEMFRKKMAARGGGKAKAEESAGASFAEKLVLLFFVLVCLYVGSPFFRQTVKKTFVALVFGAEAAEALEEPGSGGAIFGSGADDGDIVEDL